MKDYLDFDLLIERSEEGYCARVLNSPSGQASGGFGLPFSDLEVENFVLRLNRPRRGVRRVESSEMAAAKEFGGQLFQAVFDGEVLACLQSSLTEADQKKAGLRIRLRLSNAPELVDLPWEYLYNPALNRFLSLSVDTPLVRYLDLPGRIEPLAVEAPLRVLVMISSPADYPPLDTEAEWTKLKESVGDLERQGLIVLERLETPTLAALQHQIRRKGYHVFHFVGHGGFNEQEEDGVLILEDEDKHSREVSGQYLGMLLHDEKTLRLAILNACEGGRTSRTDPFAGVGQSLLQQGIPAVIAMQFEITDEAAITLSHEFYAAIAEGYPVDAALAEARKGIFAHNNEVEWATPVLYLRASDGRIFDIAKGVSPAPVEEGPAAQSAAPPAAASGEQVDSVSAVAGQVAEAPRAAPEARQPEPEVAAASSGNKLWLAIGALLALLVVGAAAFIIGRGGLGAVTPVEKSDTANDVPAIALTDETDILGAAATPTPSPSLAETDTPTQAAAIAEPEPTSTPLSPTLASTSVPTPAPAPTDTPALSSTSTPENQSLPTSPVFDGKLAIPLQLGFESKVYVTGFDGQGINGPSPVGLSGSQPMFSRDGESLILNGTAADLSGVFLTDARGRAPKAVIERDSAHWPVLSPDGSEVIFADVTLDNRLFRWKGDGEPSELAAISGPLLARSVLWSDDNRLVFQGCAVWSGKGGECGTWVADANNIDPVRIVVGNDGWPMDARNGLLAYMSAEDGDWDIYLISLDGGQPQNISNNDSQDGLAAIAPDAKSVAYLSNESGTWALWTVTLSNGEKQRWFDIDPQRGAIDVNDWYLERMSWGR